METAKSVTKSVDIESSVNAAFEYLANAENWPQWAVVNMLSVKRSQDGWYDTTTRFGKGRIRLNLDQPKGILDHTWLDPQASWSVPARLVANGQGCTFMMTFFKPPILSDSQFIEAMKEMDAEFTQLKKILEQRSL